MQISGLESLLLNDNNKKNRDGAKQEQFFKSIFYCLYACFALLLLAPACWAIRTYIIFSCTNICKYISIYIYMCV